MQSKKKDSKAQEETPVEDTVTVSLEEYQMLREAAKNQEHGKKGKKVVSPEISPGEMRAQGSQSPQDVKTLDV